MKNKKYFVEKVYWDKAFNLLKKDLSKSPVGFALHVLSYFLNFILVFTHLPQRISYKRFSFYNYLIEKRLAKMTDE